VVLEDEEDEDEEEEEEDGEDEEEEVVEEEAEEEEDKQKGRVRVKRETSPRKTTTASNSQRVSQRTRKAQHQHQSPSKESKPQPVRTKSPPKQSPKKRKMASSAVTHAMQTSASTTSQLCSRSLLSFNHVLWKQRLEGYINALQASTLFNSDRELVLEVKSCSGPVSPYKSAGTSSFFASSLYTSFCFSSFVHPITTTIKMHHLDRV